MPYMVARNPRINRKQRIRFNIAHFKKTVNLLFEWSDFPYAKRGERQITCEKDVILDYRNMKFELRGFGDGLKRNRKELANLNIIIP